MIIRYKSTAFSPPSRHHVDEFTAYIAGKSDKKARHRRAGTTSPQTAGNTLARQPCLPPNPPGREAGRKWAGVAVPAFPGARPTGTP